MLGNLKGIEDKKLHILTIHRTITPTEEYQVRMSNHYKWLEKNGLEGSGEEGG